MPDVASPIRLWNKVCQRPEALIGVAAKEICFLRLGELDRKSVISTNSKRGYSCLSRNKPAHKIAKPESLHGIGPQLAAVESRIYL